MELFLFIAVLALLGLAAQQWGVDTRITNLDPNDQTNTVSIV